MTSDREPALPTLAEVAPSLLDSFLAEADLALGHEPVASQSGPRAARPRASGEEGERHMLISMAGQEYAPPAHNILEVSHPLRVSRVPNVPEWLLGLANVRGDIVSVVDVRAFLGLGAGEASGQNRMVVVRSSAEDLTTTLLVDRVRSIR